MKHALFAASLVIVAGTAVGCGSSSSTTSATSATSTASSPAPAGSSSSAAAGSSSTFCAALTTFGEAGSAITAEVTPAQITALKSTATAMGAAAPSDIPADADAGLKVLVSTFEGVPDDASLSDLNKVGSALTAGDKANVTAFEGYAQTECTPAASPSASAS